MYKLHLILKYLRKRRIAWVSLVAVMLCTTMVLVVISIMGGWLRMFERNFHALSGDIIITSGQLRGFPHYEEILAEVDRLPFVKASAPVIYTFGLININNQKVDGVQVFGYHIDKMTRISGFGDSLYYQHRQYKEASTQPSISSQEKQQLEERARKGSANASFKFSPLPPDQAAALAARRQNWPGMIVGSGVLEMSKEKTGWEGRDLFKFRLPATLALFNAESGNYNDPGAITRTPYSIADDSYTGVYQYDSRTVYVPFDIAQRDVGMAGRTAEDEQGRTVHLPARTNQIQIRVAEGTDLKAAKEQIQEIVQRVLTEWRDKDELAGVPSRFYDINVRVQTWREDKAEFINAVEHEKVLLVFLFAIISVVAIFLIFCIFYMIVVEKTRDIGIVKSVGATSQGIAGIFLGYGAVIGIVGGGMGLLLGYLIIHNINELHAFLAAKMGIEVWNAKTYIFDTIPNTLDPKETTIIVSVAVLSSILGALVPAIRAARMNPVEAVRYE